MAPIKSNNPLASYFDFFSKSGLDAVNQYVAPQGLTASGGVISDYEVSGTYYRAHVFTSSGTFDVTSLGSFGDEVEYLVIAGGGGGGGGYYGGGGGAGGLRTNLSGHPLATGNPSFPVSTTGGNGSGSYTVTVGSGGAPGTFSGSYNTGNDAGQGIDSYFGPPSAPEGITSKGGGRGMGRSTSIGAATAGYPGGSGGGIAYRGPDVGYGYNPSTPSPITPNIPSPHPYGITQGNPGGTAPDTSTYGSAGGGAGAAGGNGTNSPYGAPGGAGVQVAIAGPTATTFTGVGALNPATSEYQWFAGGGAGGSNGPTQKLGGVGGGGASGNALNDVDAESGLFGTGGGGGGGTDTPNPSPGGGGSGGSGVVIVRYQITSTQSGTAKATGGSVYYFDNKTIHVFTNSGTFANPTALNGGSANPLNAEYVVIGGGGGGGKHNGGGGGAGGYTEGPTTIASASSFAVTIGAGGAPGYSVYPSHPGLPSALWDGTDTTVAFPAGTITGGKGGGGANEGSAAGGAASRNGSSVPLGSGGGAGRGYPGGGSGGTSGTQGYDGGAGGPPGNTACGGGGGGAGGTGVSAPGSPNYASGGGGGLGRQVPSTFRDPQSLVGAPGPTGAVPGTNPGGNTSGTHWVCGGGGGRGAADPAGNTGTYMSGYGGTGVLGDPTVTTSYAGGGRGGFGPNPGLNTTQLSGIPGAENTGGGGGGAGGSEQNDGINGGAGGSGIVLIAYPT